MFESLLIANRGEIACRIVRTCRRLGIRSIAVYSDADRHARHVAVADEALHLGAAPAGESYLAIDKVLAAAARTGAAAVHPGYGFLAENPAFARAVIEAGLVFVGPPAAAMERMGGKDTAKLVMAEAGVPLVPGYLGDDQSDDVLEREALGLGFPLLIKAAAGGGGKGMRRVERPQDFVEALAACRREAKAAFAEDRVLLERYVENPRHVELQVFADAHGNAVHLFERDCTLQRRHQKIIEEAPAPGLPADLRRSLGEAAVKAALASGYQNAGTVEFLLDRQGAFYFIEMNTRLQVEHPVTEAITGLDLVEWQVRVAAGEPLPLRQDEIVRAGHAFEARLYAEDPQRDFLPSTGRLRRLRLPEGLESVRVDTGVAEGDVVTSFYDPMIAKIIAHGSTREEALARLVGALDLTEVEGPATNLAFLRRVASSSSFRAMSIDTGWLDREGLSLATGADSIADEDYVRAALAHLALQAETVRETARIGGDPWAPWSLAGGWRLNAPAHRRAAFRIGGARIEVIVEGEGEALLACIGDRQIPVMAGYDSANGRFWAEIGGRQSSYTAYVDTKRLVLVCEGRRLAFPIDEGLGAGAEEDAGAGLIAAPMPGKLTRLFVKEGDVVARGGPLAILEAMKMEHRFEAPRAGTVTAVHVREGEQVEEGTVLLDLVAKQDE